MNHGGMHRVMRRRVSATAWVALFCVSLICPLRGAPLPPMGKVDIDGTIEKATWEPEKKLKSNKGMSGSAGRDRTLPAHFVVTLKGFSGPTVKQAAMMNSFVGAARSGDPDHAMPSRLTVWINSNDASTLKPGMRIRIPGYTVTGDEGGTWSHHGQVQIHASPSPKPGRD
jgi:hypothetical protein